MTLSTEIQEAIKKNLSGMVATELQQYIAQAEEDKRKLTDLQSGLVEKNLKITSQAREIEELKALNNSAAANDLKSAELQERERNLKVTLAEARVVAAEAAKADIYTLVHGLFRNTEYKKQVGESHPIMTQPLDYQGKPTGTPYPQQVHIHKEFTEEAK